MGEAERLGDSREKRLERWIGEYGDSVLRTCFVLLGDAAQAEDAMQDTFIKAWRHTEQFEGRGGCGEKTWLMRIAVNTCRDYRRGSWFRHVDLSRALEELPPALQAVEPEDRSLLLDIMRLPEKHRQVILLYYYQEMTLEEAAQALRIGKSAVHHRLRAAQELLRQALMGRNRDET